MYTYEAYLLLCRDVAYPVSHSIEMIEQGLDSIQYIPDDTRQRWLNSILANQYTMTEIADFTCYNRLKDR